MLKITTNCFVKRLPAAGLARSLCLLAVTASAMLHGNAGAAPELPTQPEQALQQLGSTAGLRLELLRWKFQQAVGAAEWQRISSDQGNAKLRELLLNDSQWLEGFLGSGELEQAAAAWDNLAVIYQYDKSIALKPLYQRLATATALEYARNKWPQADMLERYKYFQGSHAKGQLNPIFERLGFWDMRIVAGAKNAAIGHPVSLAWQRDNVKLPAADYPRACWQAPYRLKNIFGDSIHGRDYYLPFMDIYGDNQALRTRNVGAVCGGLSHYGAFAAIANGIPALTMGEPGHCAFTVRVNMEKWQPAYSLHWKRGCHWSFWGGNWHMLILTQNMFTHVQLKQGYDALWLGEYYLAQNQPQAALQAFQKGLAHCNLHYPLWQAYLQLVVKNADKAQMQQAYALLLGSLAKDYPAVVQQLLDSTLLAPMLAKCSDDKQKLELLLQFNRSLVEFGCERWDFENWLETIKKHYVKSPERTIDLCEALATVHMSNAKYSPLALSWCQAQVASNPQWQTRFLTKLASLSSAQGGLSEDSLRKVLGEALVAAGQNGDMATFQAIGKMLAKDYKPMLPKFEPFAGDLLSSGGVVKFSSVSKRFGQAWQHWGLLENCGGSFHTDNQQDAWIELRLPRVGELSGIVVVLTPNQHHRLKNLQVEISADGTSWQQVSVLANPKRVERIELKNTPQAQFVRITRKGKDFFHLNAVLVYGKRNA